MSAADARAAPGPIDPGLTAQALLYANGELEGNEAVAFEKRLGDDQQAREALCQAVLLTQTLDGGASPLPDPAYRDRVRECLLPAGRAAAPPAWWRTVLRPHVYRGHPLVWLLAGALAPSVVLFCQPGQAPVAPASQTETGIEVAISPQPPEPRPEPPHAAMARVWAELHSIDHLERVRAEETRRKHRLEERRLAHTDMRTSRGVSN